MLGFCTGAVAGLVTVTPACGFVGNTASVLIGVLGGAVPFLACTKLKGFFRYDDALDVFGVHGVGGTVGVLLTGIFAAPAVNPNLAANLSGLVGHTLWREQLQAMGVAALLSVGGTAVIGWFVQLTVGLRPTIEAEQEGLDLSDHGEEGYIFEAKS